MERSGFHWGWIVFAAIAAVIVLGLFSTFFAGPGYQYYGYSPGMMLYPFLPFGFHWIWFVFGLLFLFWIARWFFWPWGWRHRRGYWYGDEAYHVLRTRYAKGEITKEQFDQMMRDLEQQG